MPKSLRVGIIGVGHFGYFHAQKSHAHPLEQLVGVFDLDRHKAFSVAKDFDVSFFSQQSDLLESVDAVIIATPATTHFTLAKQALERGKHVFLEKPLSVSREEGEALISLSKKIGKVLQVGHLVTFSLPPQKILNFIPKPIKMQMRRSVPFLNRGSDVSVILDLMIHDLEFLFSLMGEKGVLLEACGRKYQTHYLDEVRASFLFKKTCRVDLFASRAASKPERFFLIEGEKGALKVDFVAHELLFFEKDHLVKQISWQKKDLLWEEHDAFTQSCLFGKENVSSLESAYQALCMANLLEKEIIEQIQNAPDSFSLLKTK
ncbi:Gfo/Idh/MocA family oxidoreductase [Acetobacteraceae bacterium]|nr:Gfo/Idh/MocA family oxidoreductase [Acetobacteraceae bacterium]